MAVLEHEQAGVVDRLRQHIGRAAVKLGGVKGKVERIAKQRLHRDLAARVGQGQQHAVELPARQGLAGRRRHVLAQVELQLGEGGAQLRQQARQQERRDRRNDAEPELAAERLAAAARHRRELVRLAQDRVGLGDDSLAERGEAHHPLRALHQDRAEKQLELAQAGRQRRLRDMDGVRRAAEMAVLVQGGEILQLLQGRQEAHETP